MSIEHPAELVTRVRALLRDTAPLHTAAGLAFAAPPRITTDAVAALAGDRAWTFVDARGLAKDDATTRLADALARAQKGKGTALVVVVDEHGPQPAFRLAQALADRRAGDAASCVDLGDRVERALPDDLSAVIVVAGVDDHERLPRALQRVDFWELL